MQEITGHGYMFPGHDVTRVDALVQVRAALESAGVDPFDAEERTIDRRGLVVRAWWGVDDNGEQAFVPTDRPDAEPVTVVNIEPPEVTDGAFHF